MNTLRDIRALGMRIKRQEQKPSAYPSDLSGVLIVEGFSLRGVLRYSMDGTAYRLTIFSLDLHRNAREIYSENGRRYYKGLSNLYKKLSYYIVNGVDFTKAEK